MDLGIDLLTNPKQVSEMSSGPSEVNITELDSLNIESLNLNFDEAPVGRSREAGPSATEAPSFMPSLDEFSNPQSSDGFANLASDNFLPKEPSFEAKRPMSNLEINKRKRELIRYFERCEKRGKGPARRFTMDDSLEEMELEKKAMASDANVEFVMQLMEWGTISVASGAEYLGDAVPRLGLKMKGYSQNVNDTMDEFYEVFDEMIDDWGDTIKFSPGMKYVMLLARGAIATHTANKLTSAFGPDVMDVMKSNPDLMKNFVNAMTEKTAQNMGAAGGMPQAQSAPQRRMDPLSEMGRFMGMGMGGPPAPVHTVTRTPDFPQAQVPRPKPATNVVQGVTKSIPAPKPLNIPSMPRREMSGPKNMDDIMKSINLSPPSMIPEMAPAPFPKVTPPGSVASKGKSGRSIKNTVSLDI
jgi:hypothetical protein